MWVSLCLSLLFPRREDVSGPEILFHVGMKTYEKKNKPLKYASHGGNLMGQVLKRDFLGLETHFL